MRRTTAAISLVALGGCLQVTGPLLGDSGVPGGAVRICSSACGAGEICLDGGCIDRCIAVGQVRCDGGCADVATDDANCGACGSACPIGAPCHEGTCQPRRCPMGQMACGDAEACVDLSADSNNCGACGIVCVPGAACAKGQCPPLACPADLMLCVDPDAGPACVQPQIDPQNCGACGLACGAGTFCRTGTCRCDPPTDSCPSAIMDAGMICTDFRTDLKNCGGCAITCLACETCTDGACVPIPQITFDFTLPILGPNQDGYFDVLSLAVADINGDGLPDILFAGSDNPIGTVFTSASVGWMLALSDGGYAAPIYSTISGLAPTNSSIYEIQARVESADFNRDGIDDIAVLFIAGFDGGDNATLEILTGAASGAPAVTYTWLGAEPPPGLDGTALGIGDLNRDGFPDVVMSTETSGMELMTFINAGKAGGFAPPVVFQAEGGYLFNSLGVVHLGVADMNQDGLPDIIIPAGVYLQLSDGGFGPLLLQVGPGGVTYQDLVSYPGHPAVFLENASNEVSRWYSSPSGPQLETTSEPIFPDPGLYSPCSVDVNGDGLADVILLPYTQAYLEVCLLRGSSFDCGSISSGTFGRPIAAWQTDSGVRVLSGLQMLTVTCPGLP